MVLLQLKLLQLTHGSMLEKNSFGSDQTLTFQDTYINANASLVLEAVGSHVYPESISVSDPHSNAQASYRVVSNGTSDAAFVADLVEGVDNVLMHGPTDLYGSTSATAGADAVRLENNTIENVYPVTYYGASATIGDSDLVPPEAHVDGESGEFVAMTVEVNAGTDGSGVIVVSGASPYGDYKPMYASEYYDVPLTGHLLVKQTIEFGMDFTMEPFDPTATTTEPPTTTDTGTTATNTTDTDTGPGDGFTIDPMILMVAVGAIVVVVIIVIVVKKR